jgi:6,7-dimethyl-8-ribityllumazine synthase
MSGADAHDHAPVDSADAFNHRGVTAETGPRGAAGSRWAIVVSRFNGRITDALFRGAVDALVDAGAKPEHIRAVTVPGAVELPLAANALAEASHGVAGIIALGCVIRGETAHFDYVCSAATDGIMRVQLDHDMPIGLGLVTCDTVAQAEARAQLTPDGHNVGADAARAALELAGLVRITRSS